MQKPLHNNRNVAISAVRGNRPPSDRPRAAAMTQLYWLPTIEDWRERLRRFGEAGDAAWGEAVALAGARLDAVQTNALDTMVRRTFAEPPKDAVGEAGAPGDPRIEHLDPSATGDPRRRAAAADVGRDLRERLRPVLAGIGRSRTRRCISSSRTRSCSRSMPIISQAASAPASSAAMSRPRSRRPASASATAGAWRAKRSAVR